MHGRVPGPCLQRCSITAGNTKRAELNTSGSLRGPWRSAASGGQTLPINSGSYSSATCSLLINGTHSVHQVRLRTKKPFHLPSGACFSPPISVFVKWKGFIMMLTLWRAVESRLGGWRSRLVTVPLQCFLPLEIHQEPKHKSRACFGLLQHCEKRAGTRNWPFFNGRVLLLLLLFLLVLSSWCKVCEWIKVPCVAQRCGFVLLVAQLPLWRDVTWKADESHDLHTHSLEMFPGSSLFFQHKHSHSFPMSVVLQI